MEKVMQSATNSGFEHGAPADCKTTTDQRAQNVCFPYTDNVLDGGQGKVADSDSAGSADADNLPTKTTLSRSTKVLLLRGLNQRTTEADLQSAVAPFNSGASAKIFLRLAAGQAFIEFDDEAKLAAALNYLTQNPVSIKGALVRAFPSKREHVTIGGAADSTKVVLVSVNSLMYRVELETLYGLMSRCGTVDKIVIFAKNPMLQQALVQFRDVSEARKAIATLHNRNMYENCNTLQIVPSKLSEINVSTNDRTKSWDFTVKSSLIDSVSETGSNGGFYSPSFPSQSLMQQPWDAHGTPLFASPQHAGFQQQMVAPHGMPLLGQPADKRGMRGLNVGVMPHGVQHPLDPMSTAKGMTPSLAHSPPPTPVVICYNIAYDRVNVQKLFNLFSLYGFVKRIKMLKDKPDTALVQYSYPAFAQLARSCLHEVEVFDRQLQIASSKNWEIKMPMRNDDEDDDTPKRTVEFAKRDQRYKEEEHEKYTKSACRPTATLFVANIADSVTKEDLTNVLSTVTTPRTISLHEGKSTSNKKFAIIAVASASKAVEVVCTLHNHDLHGSNIKVAFSKRVL
eukprot:Selendium_serpulae@DN4266_c0_g1_i1.p1